MQGEGGRASAAASRRRASPGNIAKNGQTPLVSISVQAKKRRLASCAANALAQAVDRQGRPPSRTRRSTTSARRSRTTSATSTQINSALESGSLSATDKLVVQIRLAQAQTDKLQTSQLLLQAKQVEAPSILTGAASQKVTARSRRNTVVVAALIGLILGALAALVWDGVAARFRRG